MLSIFADVFSTATRTSRWDAPDHWRQPDRGPHSDRRAEEDHRAILRRQIDRTGRI